jgi:DNA-binding IclR family transcriptional regulator
MSKQAPAVDRALRILAELAARPDEALTLSELARAAGINLSTCHSIVTSLSEASYLLRHEPLKAYTLGPAVVEVGTAALRQYPGLPAARAEAEELARRFDLPVTVSARAGDELIVLAHAATARRPADTVQGFRGPMVPPLGRVFMAWADDHDVERWLQRLELPPDSAEIKVQREALAAVRDRGYVLSLDATVGEFLIQLAVQLAHAATQRERVEIGVRIADLLRTEEYAYLGQADGPVHRRDIVAAPVFRQDGQVALALAVAGRPGDITDDVTAPIVRGVVAAAKRVTLSIGGREHRLASA